jgi:hypothetical protein
MPRKPPEENLLDRAYLFIIRGLHGGADQTGSGLRVTAQGIGVGDTGRKRFAGGATFRCGKAGGGRKSKEGEQKRTTGGGIKRFHGVMALGESRMTGGV